MLTSIFNTTAESFIISDALICLIAALIMGFIIAFTYMASGTYTKSFAISLVLLPALVQIVITIVNGNLGTGVAVLGAFSLVRFRSVPGSSKEISFIFFTMAAGLAVGAGYVGFGFIITLVICLVFILLSRTPFGERKSLERSLKITIPENLDYTKIFDDLFDKYTEKASLEKVKTTNLGSMFELQYNVVLKEEAQEKSFIDEIRCRNGNLTIICSRQQIVKDEL